MAAVYSTQFIALAEGDQVYEVPTGFIAIIRDMNYVSNPLRSVGNTFCIVQIENVETGYTLSIWEQVPPYVQGGQSYHWEGRIVIPANWRIVGQVGDVNSGLVVSGYLLTAP